MAIVREATLHVDTCMWEQEWLLDPVSAFPGSQGTVPQSNGDFNSYVKECGLEPPKHLSFRLATSSRSGTCQPHRTTAVRQGSDLKAVITMMACFCKMFRDDSRRVTSGKYAWLLANRCFVELSNATLTEIETALQAV